MSDPMTTVINNGEIFTWNPDMFSLFSVNLLWKNTETSILFWDSGAAYKILFLYPHVNYTMLNNLSVISFVCYLLFYYFYLLLM